MYEGINETATYAERPTSGYPTEANAKVSDTPRVLAEYGRLSEGLKMLTDTFDRLRIKLEPVTGPSRPTAEIDSSKNPQESLSPLAESFRGEASSVYRLNSAMRDLCDRIEV